MFKEPMYAQRLPMLMGDNRPIARRTADYKKIERRVYAIKSIAEDHDFDLDLELDAVLRTASQKLEVCEWPDPAAALATVGQSKKRSTSVSRLS